ncbi:MAG TPA: FkbM family methyltransferase [Steroidobacteraceae bacterium]|nr:FkbM family methyltransferase [Steroidobacteraceae bacterium]
MIVNTHRLFTRLLARLRIGLVCDVGSMDGADALCFSKAAPHARVLAFEPNPENLRLMQANPALSQRNIQLVPMAATDSDGEAEFFLVAADYARDDPRRGMSSLLRRADEWSPAATVRVRTTRLDRFLAEPLGGLGIALWIDTEGKAYETIGGATGIAQHVRVLHVEVETVPCVATGQKLYPQVKALLERLGFRQLATDMPATHAQFNAVFTRVDLPADLRFQVGLQLLLARLRYVVGSLLARLSPTGAGRLGAVWRRLSRD